VDPIQINTNIDLPTPQQELTVIGFGKLTDGGLSPTELQELQVQYIPTDDCNADYYSNVPSIRPVSMMCVRPVDDDEDRGQCNGDSGGPLFTKNEVDGTFLQYGIVSHHKGDCGDRKHLDIHARISGEIDWIVETICDLTESSNGLEMCQEKDAVQESLTTVDVTLKITYDKNAAETGWYFQHENGEVVRDPLRYEHMFNNPLYDTPGGPYEHTVSLYPGEEASFTISDLYGDGNCCEFGNGQYEVWYKNGDDEDDLLLLEGKGDFRHFRTETFTVPGEKEIDKAPPAEFIGEAEDYVSAGESLGIGCFSGSTLVHRREQTDGKEQYYYYKWVPLSEIQIGDSIQVSPGGKFEPIYAFGHYQPEMEGDYLELQFTDNDDNKLSLLQISKEHLIWTPNRGAIPACDLTIGQEVVLAEGGGASSTTTTTVTGIQPIIAKGIYAPFTPSGTLVLNHGLLASSYVSLDNFTNKMMIIPNYYHHALAHFFTTPHRLWCQGTNEFCSNPMYTKDGINVWESQLLLWIPRIIMAGLLLVCGLLFLLTIGVKLVSKKGLINKKKREKKTRERRML